MTFVIITEAIVEHPLIYSYLALKENWLLLRIYAKSCVIVLYNKRLSVFAAFRYSLFSTLSLLVQRRYCKKKNKINDTEAI
jgi:hypothetical protein